MMHGSSSSNSRDREVKAATNCLFLQAMMDHRRQGVVAAAAHVLMAA